MIDIERAALIILLILAMLGIVASAVSVVQSMLKYIEIRREQREIDKILNNEGSNANYNE